jgi:hypothetical protein
MSDAKRAIEIRRLVSEINRYRFVGESGLSVAVIVGAVQRAVKGLMNLQIPIPRTSLPPWKRSVSFIRVQLHNRRHRLPSRNLPFGSSWTLHGCTPSRTISD